LDIGVLGYIGIVWPKEHSPEVWHIPPGTPCIYIYKVPEQGRKTYFGKTSSLFKKIFTSFIADRQKVDRFYQLFWNVSNIGLQLWGKKIWCFTREKCFLSDREQRNANCTGKKNNLFERKQLILHTEEIRDLNRLRVNS